MRQSSKDGKGGAYHICCAVRCLRALLELLSGLQKTVCGSSLVTVCKVMSRIGVRNSQRESEPQADASTVFDSATKRS